MTKREFKAKLWTIGIIQVILFCIYGMILYFEVYPHCGWGTTFLIGVLLADLQLSAALTSLENLKTKL